MRAWYAAFLVTVSGSTAVAGGLQGTPQSPLSWTAANIEEPRTHDFSPRQNALGLDLPPSAVQLVELSDARPYGEDSRQTVWLARYDSVPVLRPDSTDSVSITLSLAFDLNGDLLCAFTESAPSWDRSNQETGDIEADLGWRMYPAQSEKLRSRVPDVITALWWQWALDPRQVGQIILRPRFNNNELGMTILHDPPCNVWLIEVLGRFITNRHGVDITTLIYCYRDGDLKGLVGSFRP